MPSLGSPYFCLDDAYIHLAYTLSLKLGEGLSYNPHDWETGVSAPLWVLVLALWPGGAPPVLAVKLLGTALHGVGAALMALLPAHAQPSSAVPRVACWASGLMWAATPLAIQAAVSGMEVPLAVVLALAATLMSLRERAGWAALCAGLGYLTRPELAVYFALLALGLALSRRSARALGALLGAVLGCASFAGYCLAVSGYSMPNTFYVKGRPSLNGLLYLVLEVLPREPTVCSIAGVLLAGWALRDAITKRRWTLPVVFGSALVAMLATAASRPLYPGVQFFQSRYFVPLLWSMPLLAAFGLTALERWPRALAAVALVVASALSLARGWSLTAAQEQGVARLHVEPARYIAARAGSDGISVLGVEGAGALRFLTPRNIRVIDMVGLNDAKLAHGDGNFFRKLCHLRSLGVTHMAYPAQWQRNLGDAFELATSARFVEPSYAQLDPPAAWATTVAKVRGFTPDFARFCDGAGTPGH